MDILKIPYLTAAAENDLQQMSIQLDELKAHELGNFLWPTSTYKPQVQFVIGYSKNAILLKYSVKENYLRACCTADNELVYEDSCVEFFVSFNNETAYYNLEFNCVGICLAAFGANKTERQLLPIETMAKIKRYSNIKSFIENDVLKTNWQLTLFIPFTTFVHHPLTLRKGTLLKGNFYKCGDGLPLPHYLAWKEIKSEKPNFHLPQYFGCLQFD